MGTIIAIKQNNHNNQNYTCSPCDSAIPKKFVDQMNDDLVQNMYFLDKPAIHNDSYPIWIKAMQSRIKRAPKMHNTKGQCLQVNLRIHKFIQTGFVVSRPAAAPPRSRGRRGRRSISLNHSKIIQESAYTLLVSFTKFDKPRFGALT